MELSIQELKKDLYYKSNLHTKSYSNNEDLINKLQLELNIKHNRIVDLDAQLLNKDNY